MAQLGVGIHEGITLGEGTGYAEGKNGKSFIKIVFEQIVKIDNYLEMFDSNESAENGKQSIVIFGINATDFNGNQKESAALIAEVQLLKRKLQDTLSMHMTVEQASSVFGTKVIFNGTGVLENPANLPNLITQQAVLDKVYENLGKAFDTAAKNLVGVNPFRVKLPRQSEAKHSATIQCSKGDTWIESMLVPKDQSKVMWTAWQIETKRFDGTPVAPDVVVEEGAPAFTAPIAPAFSAPEEVTQAVDQTEAAPDMFSAPAFSSPE